ncbi:MULTISPECIES: MaoC family dehydratase [unclassified Nocardioides]|uniref:MaoC family dehydratase n=1 Tax=unclassified Nocardioides TaxID=2615069 RepID=UPI0006F2EF78|nr:MULTISPECIES: MaoC family dehydratase [unclassified Nocardioides]KQY56238.1 dehydratase [Nocardioides sp. Root140]KQZ75022.1 dehydratase [Nocardioides sp. Root151]KRF10557.1 dehydratase [Nocardioides sp. Soil796]
MTKTNPGNFFEDFTVGQVLRHATPRTVTEGDRALYGALYPTRFAVPSSAEFAKASGLDPAPVEELVAFHIAFGKTVPDISLNAVANLGYAECRFHQPVVPGDTLSTSSEVIGLKQNSNGRSGVVYVRSTATNQRGEVALDWARWVMVHKRDHDAPAPETVVPDLAASVAAKDLVLPAGLDFTAYDFAAAGEPHSFGDYEVGEKIDHVDGVTLTDPEHMLATRLWQNTAKVHFNTEARPDGTRLIYGGHVISMARALSFNGLANAQLIAAINAGAHTAPAFAGDTVYAWSEVLDKATTSAPGVGALRLRLVATKGRDESMTLRNDEGKYAAGVLLDLDYWALVPR